MEKTAANRGLGAEAIRQELLNAVERVFYKDGHAKISYRVVAARAGVTPSLVQYYFPTIDTLFAAMIHRLIDRDIDRWNNGLQSRPDEPLRVLWEYSWAEAAGAFGTEMLALGTRRPALLPHISEGTERIRKAQLQAVEQKYGSLIFLDDVFPPDAMVLLVTSIPKVLTLEESVQVNMAHRSLINAFERFLDTVEPKSNSRVTKPSPSRAPVRGHLIRGNDPSEFRARPIRAQVPLTSSITDIRHTELGPCGIASVSSVVRSHSVTSWTAPSYITRFPAPDSHTRPAHDELGTVRIDLGDNTFDSSAGSL